MENNVIKNLKHINIYDPEDLPTIKSMSLPTADKKAAVEIERKLKE